MVWGTMPIIIGPSIVNWLDFLSGRSERQKVKLMFVLLLIISRFNIMNDLNTLWADFMTKES